MPANQKYCPSCGACNPQDVVFCISCGSKFPQMTSQPSAVYPQPSMTTSAPSFPQTNTPASRSDFITLSCPNCGGKLQITPDIERFACQFCGYEHIVRRSGGIISLEPVVQAINMMGVGVSKIGSSSEKQAAETTIARLKGEIGSLTNRLEWTPKKI